MFRTEVVDSERDISLVACDRLKIAIFTAEDGGIVFFQYVIFRLQPRTPRQLYSPP
jgi:hypothetical protein